MEVAFDGKVISGYKKQRRKNKRTKIEIWVDYDIYQRNDNDCMDQYRLKARGIPDFRFSYHNFEDFLVLHMEDEKVRKWSESVRLSGHLTTPLHSKEYAEIFECIVTGYKKGDLSPDFISKESLLRFKQNIQNPIIPAPVEVCFGNFATFLIDQIDEAYPGLLI